MTKDDATRAYQQLGRAMRQIDETRSALDAAAADVDERDQQRIDGVIETLKRQRAELRELRGKLFLFIRNTLP